jgi:hypothetical protein
MTQWQPIEMAPKDETWVLLWFPEDAPAPEPRVRSGFWSEEYADWFDSEAAGNSLTEILGAPTHWAALTAPNK